MENKKIILEVKGLKKYFPLKKDIFGKPLVELKAVDNVTFKLEAGKTIGVVGESGCGKTTLGRTILQLYDTTGGKTLYYGHKLEEFLPKYYIKGVNKLDEYKKQLDNLLTFFSTVDDITIDLNTITIEELTKYIEKVSVDIDIDIAVKDDVVDKKQLKDEIKRLRKIKSNLNKLVTLLQETACITGGLVLCDDEKVKSLLLNKINKEHEIYKTDVNSENFKLLKAELEEFNKSINDVKSHIANTPLYIELENMREKGLDLAKLTKEELRSLRTEIQLIFQDPYSSLPPRMTIGSILTEPVKVHKIVESDEVSNHVRKVMKMCGLQPQYYDRYPHEFSGGQRQRICIARALVVNPKLVICDEPVSALDVSIQAQIINLLKDLQKKLGLTYMFISHDLSVVKYITDDIIVMYLGNMMEIGNTKDIFENPLHPYTKALFSAVPVPDPDAKMNRIILKGDIPSPANPPKGCKFHTRCDQCMSVCKLKNPEFIQYDDNHVVACHLYNKEIMADLDKYDQELLSQEENKVEEK